MRQRHEELTGSIPRLGPYRLGPYRGRLGSWSSRLDPTEVDWVHVVRDMGRFNTLTPTKIDLNLPEGPLYIPGLSFNGVTVSEVSL